MVLARDRAKCGFDRAQGLTMSAEIAEYGASPIQRLRFAGGASVRHLRSRQRSDIVAHGRRDLAFDQPAVHRIWSQGQRLIDYRVGLGEHRVITGAKELARS